MKKIMTVCGPIAPDALGLTSMHDHILADLSGLRQSIPESLLKDCPINLDNPIKNEARKAVTLPYSVLICTARCQMLPPAPGAL